MTCFTLESKQFQSDIEIQGSEIWNDLRCAIDEDLNLQVTYMGVENGRGMSMKENDDSKKLGGLLTQTVADKVESTVTAQKIEKKKKELQEKRKEELQEELLKDTAERNELSENDDIDAFLQENYKDEQSKEYLVDGAALTCTNSTKTNVSIMIDGKMYDYCAKKNEDVDIEPADNSKIYGRLTVTENACANVDGFQYATVADSQKEKNIPYFGNCLCPPQNEEERAKLRGIHNDAGVEKRKEGSCKYLMELNKLWENYEIEDNFLTFGDDVEGEISGITMTSMLFCKHGGFIYPVFSGQIPTDKNDDFIKLFENLDAFIKQQAIDLAVRAVMTYYNAKTTAKSAIKCAEKEARAFIPQNVSNDALIFAMEVLSMNYPVFWTTREKNADDNFTTLTSSNTPYTAAAYIENQSEWGNVKFGNNSNMKFSGCEVIATYNALFALGENVSEQTMIDAISRYERNGAVLGGILGTSPHQIEKYFKEKGYDVTSTKSRDEEKINNIGENSDTVIATVYNNQNDIVGEIHTVSITKDENGKYSIHNAFITNNKGEYVVKDNNGAGYDTLQDAINNISINPSTIDVIGISCQ